MIQITPALADTADAIKIGFNTSGGIGGYLGVSYQTIRSRLMRLDNLGVVEKFGRSEYRVITDYEAIKKPMKKPGTSPKRVKTYRPEAVDAMLKLPARVFT